MNYHVVALRAMLKFLLRNDIDCLSPDKLELAKIGQREVNFLTEEEVSSLLDAPLVYEQSPVKQSRDLAILAFLYGTGLRVTELITLAIDSLRLEGNQFSVVGK
jgi:site-specific recombinase XerD